MLQQPVRIRQSAGPTATLDRVAPQGQRLIPGFEHQFPSTFSLDEPSVGGGPGVDVEADALCKAFKISIGSVMLVWLPMTMHGPLIPLK